MMRSALLWHLLVTLLLLAEWEGSRCASIKIQPAGNKGLWESNAIPIRFYDNNLETDVLRRVASSDGFNLASVSRGKASRSLLLETTTSEVQVLMAFKTEITSDPLDALRSWRGNDSDACSWRGVKCSSNSNHVAAIELDDLQLEGTVSPLLGQLSFLEQLDLSNNNFSGYIPDSIANCSNLSYLNISSNQMTGYIPAQVGELRNLLILDLSSNNLTGGIPATLGNCSSLQYLKLSMNSLGGAIPSQLGRLSNLQTLDLQTCSISGSIPPALGNCTSLINLYLNYNTQLGGELPFQLGELINLQYFEVFGDNFEGNFPKWILNMTSMTYLDLGYNQFSGEIPGDIGFLLPNLSFLALSQNFFSGEIPRSIVNITALVTLDIHQNQLTGTLPPDMGMLRSMQKLWVNTNFLTGIVPPSLSNCSQLLILSVGENPEFDPQVLPSWIGSLVNLVAIYWPQMNLYGSILAEIGQLSSLAEFSVFENNLTGTVPASIGNCTSLINFEVNNNQLSGELPPELGVAPLIWLEIGYNSFSAGSIPAFIFNLTTLQYLGIQSNQYNVKRLNSYDFGKLGQLQTLQASFNEFEGSIPQSFANLSYLSYLDLEVNNLSGPIPPWLANLTDLGVLFLNYNQLSGTIPADLLRYSDFTLFDMSYNNLEGVIPGDIGLTSSLQYLFLSGNKFIGDIPSSLGNCTQMVSLDLSDNRLTGSIPGTVLAAMASSLSDLDLSQNFLSGPWPAQFSDLINLQYLNVSSNNISGSIPLGLGRCVNLVYLNLSVNQFTGPIPQDLGSLQHLMIFNASYNSFEGPIPDSGAFKKNLTVASFLGNPGLCGGILGPHRQCAVQAPPSPIRISHCRGFECASVWISVVTVAVVGILLTAFATYRYSARIHKLEDTFVFERRIKFSKADILAAIAAGEGNIIGRGANSTVYKAVLHGGEIAAMKTWRELRGGPETGPETEDEKRWEKEISSEAHTLAKLRHRNIIKVFGLYSLLDVKAILLEYMPNGSLYAKLHENGPCTLTWAERFNIILGVTEGMLYLHHEFPEPIIHRDLKSSNVLLDAEMEPKVCDFGISKMVACDTGEATASTVRGTFGYLPPEYATAARVSTKGDVYSFGVVLLEILTAKKATEVYGQNENLVNMVEHCFQNSESIAFELLDPALKHEGLGDSTSRQQMMFIMRVGLFCTMALPQSRPSMNVVREMMLQIKDVGKEPMAQKTLDDLLICDVASTSDTSENNPHSSS